MSRPKLLPVRTIAALRRRTAAWRAEGESIVFVPTMGALHAGHRRLIERAVATRGRVVVSIFVNPLQFGPGEDYDRYPRALVADLEICRDAGADLVFNPSIQDLYPEGYATQVHVAGLDASLCGPFRPGHFDGVATIVLKLLNVVRPDRLFLGQKDAQQAVIVGRMMEDLNLPVRLTVIPTVRERDGLAMSSRNRYLTPEERLCAPVLYEALRAAAESLRSGDHRPRAALSAFRRRLATAPLFRLQYAEVLDANRLIPMRRIEGRILIAAAAFLGRTRLIDNILLNVERPAPKAARRSGGTP